MTGTDQRAAQVLTLPLVINSVEEAVLQAAL